MRMYLANGTQQYIDFQYRLPEFRSYRQQTIPIGGQIVLSGELSQKDIELIIEHQSVYGMVSSKEFTRYKDVIIPYIYSIDAPISENIIAELIEQNRTVNIDQGVKRRQEAAVQVNNVIEQGTTDTLKNLEMTIEELPSKTKDPEFSEGVRVTRDKERGAPQDPKNPIDFSARKRSMF
jgi:RecG-like helicase